MLKFVGDFETTTSEKDCRVWASCIVDVDTTEVVQLCNNIDETMLLLEDLTSFKKVELYYHNLKFDGEFIISWLYNNGFTYDEDLKKAKTFRTLITDTGIFYQMEIRFHKNKNMKKLTIKDSLKIIPLKVCDLPKAFGLEETKGEIDYNKERPIGYELDQNEKEYIINDCKIVAQSLNYMFQQGLTKMTIASNALNFFKETIGGTKTFRHMFPLLNKVDDDYIRQSYKGGYTYVDERRKNKWINKTGCTYDVNSLYPSQMHSISGNLLPYGMPIFYKGEYPQNEYYPLYIQRIKCHFKLKKGFVPTIQIKNNSRFLGRETEYIKESGTERVELILTSVDFETFKKHYDIWRIDYLDGYMFKGRQGLFDTYIDHWNNIKEQATIDKNNGLRTIAKLMNNSLYGKFAVNSVNDVKIPILQDNGVVSQKGKVSIKELQENEKEFEDIFLKDDKDRELNYTAMASFITAYARRVTHRAIQENYDTFCYADTDSIHLIGTKAKNIDIHNSRLGAWKHECNWESAKFIRAKTYIEEINGHLDVKCAGMPDNVKEVITKKNFKIGFTTEGLDEKFQKLVPKRVVGGVVLAPQTFTIK